MTKLAPLRREVLVPAEPSVAFDVFTQQIGTWWPLAELSVYGEAASVAFVGRHLVETAPGEPPTVWGQVTTWDRPDRLAFTWHPGSDPERASRVTVTFTARDDVDGTLVRLEHDGWESYDDPAVARSEYGNGWPGVLELFRASVAPEEESTWVALLHRPGPAAPTGPAIFGAPGFADHVAFLGRMNDAGYLVAAGPLADEVGSGMTILRLPGADRLVDATKLATTDDASVVAGFFTVAVRPWQVVLHA
jgi:uncharacterized protein YndB with AHSA1/START domain/uncharacterized protein YciI